MEPQAMGENKRGFIERMEAASAAYDATYKKIKNSPEMKRKQRQGYYQVACIFLVGLPCTLAAVAICEWFHLTRSIYGPAVTLMGLIGSRLLGTYLANKKYPAADST